jgi:hypothetical protein
MRALGNVLGIASREAPMEMSDVARIVVGRAGERLANVKASPYGANKYWKLAKRLGPIHPF